MGEKSKILKLMGKGKSPKRIARKVGTTKKRVLKVVEKAERRP
jgi:DNA-binding CsgD family transcriptional regulator